MAEVVDKWSILLSLKSLGFKKGVEEINSSTKSAQKSVSGFIGEIKNIALASGAVLGLGATLASFSKNAQTLDKLSVSTGENIRMLQAWKTAAEDTGASGDSVLSSINGINSAMGRVRTSGFDPILTAMGRLRISARDSNGKFKQGSEILRDFAHATQNMDERAAGDFAAQLGIDQETFYAIRRMGGNIDAIIAKKEKLANTTQADIQKNREWQQTVAQLNNLWRSFATTIATTLIPALRWAANAFGGILQYKPVIYGMLVGMTALIGIGLVTAIKSAAVAAWGFMASIAPILPILMAVGLLIKGISTIASKSGWERGNTNAPINPSDSKMFNNIKSTMPGSRNTNMATSNNASTYNTANTRIDNVTINTKATDSKGIASDFYGDMKIIGAQGGAF